VMSWAMVVCREGTKDARHNMRSVPASEWQVGFATARPCATALQARAHPLNELVHTRSSLQLLIGMPLAISYIIARALETYTPSSAIQPHSPSVPPRHPPLLPNVHQYRSAVLLHAPRKRLKRFPLLSWESAIAIHVPLPSPENPHLNHS
jgi:hypothetical protein